MPEQDLGVLQFSGQVHDGALTHRGLLISGGRNTYTRTPPIAVARLHARLRRRVRSVAAMVARIIPLASVPRAGGSLSSARPIVASLVVIPRIAPRLPHGAFRARDCFQR